MDYIRVTKENIESEHICCAISNNKDVQVASKKAWLSDRFDDGLVFAPSEGSASLSTFPQKMPGIRSTPTATCTSTACGCPARSRGTGTRTTFWESAFATARKRAKKASASSLPPRKSLSSPTRISSSTKALRCATKPPTASAFLRCASRPTHPCRASRTARRTPASTNRATFFTIRTSARSTRSTFRSLKKPPRSTESRSKQST